MSDEINNILSELKDNLQSTGFSDELFIKLGKNYSSGKNFLEAFKEHISNLFSGTGLLFFNAGSDKIKELSKPFFNQVIKNNEKLISSFKTKSNDLEKAGYKSQVAIQDNKAYLFLNNNGIRRALFCKNDGYSLKGTDKSYSKDELITLLDENPQYISSTVLTRPLWQSWLLPTVSYVAGGAEIAYWGQISDGFDCMGLVMPQLQPRHSITLIEPKTTRLASKYEIDLLKIETNKSKFIKDFFINTKLGEINKVLSDFQSLASNNNEKVKELVENLDPTLLGPVEKSYSSISGTIEKLQNRLSNRIKEKEVTIQNHLNAIHEALLPNGVLQERILSSVYFENKYGSDWVLKLKDHLTENFNQHLTVEL